MCFLLFPSWPLSGMIRATQENLRNRLPSVCLFLLLWKTRFKKRPIVDVLLGDWPSKMPTKILYYYFTLQSASLSLFLLLSHSSRLSFRIGSLPARRSVEAGNSSAIGHKDVGVDGDITGTIRNAHGARRYRRLQRYRDSCKSRSKGWCS